MIAIWFILDVTLKFAVGALLAVFAWLPFWIFGDAPIRPWLIGGLVLGMLINGFFELCDVFCLKPLLGIRE
jgi:hypothetical protein